MSRALVVYDLRVEPAVTEADMVRFMKALLYSGNFNHSVADIWRASGMPMMHLMDVPLVGSGSRLKRVRIIP